ncbi:MAG: 50S ribosomal protein L15 [Planctomycetia bacterium]|jgi:large subunit ribosomal protein L15|nr:50S ribosomal protein L15 [Planctomycetia bacterium]
MMIHDITAKVGRHKQRKRIGRGDASGTGKTSGRGHKGMKSRSGYSRRAGYDAGGKQFYQRFPKRGFSNARFRTHYHVINVKALEELCEAGETVDVALLAKRGVVRNTALGLKVLGEGELSKKLDVKAAKFSASAKQKIEAAGGTAVEC